MALSPDGSQVVFVTGQSLVKSLNLVIAGLAALLAVRRWKWSDKRRLAKSSQVAFRTSMAFRFAEILVYSD